MSFANLRKSTRRFAVVTVLCALPLTAVAIVDEQVPNQGTTIVSEQVVPAAKVAPAPVLQTSIQMVAVQVPTVAPSSARERAVALALSKVGSPYRWGATGPSAFDCSGLVNWAFGKAGIRVPRTSRALSQTGTPVSRDQLQPGDLVFFYSPVSHVGIYIGNGQMVHASTSGKPVAVAPIDGRQYNSARRI